MKFITASLIFAAAAIAVPAPAGQGNGIAARSPVAAAFAEAFPGKFDGLSADDTNIFCSKENENAEATKAKAMKLKRDAEAAADAATVARALARRSEEIAASPDDTNIFCSKNQERAETMSAKSLKLRREADAAAEAAVEANAVYAEALKGVAKRSEDDTNVFCSKENEAAEAATKKAKMLRREADAAADAAADAYANVATALKMRAEDDTNVFCSKNNDAAEVVANKAKMLKREADAAAEAAAASEASLAKALKLRALF